MFLSQFFDRINIFSTTLEWNSLFSYDSLTECMFFSRSLHEIGGFLWPFDEIGIFPWSFDKIVIPLPHHALTQFTFITRSFDEIWVFLQFYLWILGFMTDFFFFNFGTNHSQEKWQKSRKWQKRQKIADLQINLMPNNFCSN